MRALERYPFPGNVRELEHTIERALILAGADPVDARRHLPFARARAVRLPRRARVAAAGFLAGGFAVPEIPEGLSLEVLERELILQALEKAQAATRARPRGCSGSRGGRSTRGMEKHGLRVPAGIRRGGGGGGRRGGRS